MIAVPAGVRIVVAARPVDFRNGLDGLAALVQQALRASPFSGDLFVFRAKRADRGKILAWDGTGLCLFHKRLEKGRFVWPPLLDGVMSPERGATGAAAGGIGLVAGAAKASDWAIIGGVTRQFCSGRTMASIIVACSSRLASRRKILFCCRRGLRR
jgi:transposase